MTELVPEDKVLFDEKLEILKRCPQEDWLRIIWEWSGARHINFAIFRGLLETILEIALKECSNV